MNSGKNKVVEIYQTPQTHPISEALFTRSMQLRFRNIYIISIIVEFFVNIPGFPALVGMKYIHSIQKEKSVDDNEGTKEMDKGKAKKKENGADASMEEKEDEADAYVTCAFKNW